MKKASTRPDSQAWLMLIEFIDLLTLGGSEYETCCDAEQ
ncbi:hypothetical protein C4K29_3182 [Pseudomonas chlororaphis subsp. piscium]|nr:hypothetical protein C4K33_3087 [Pseudomonas chlororaphis subsp. piscium]AZC69817.1 hypothetical protein C4K32_3155 [Pseudomonas chlororaphis subsp. piscium]AZC82297.1 hypothetical protein C4K30_3183 [Pseudomonas chlororaphis subsp. piscium]AZC89483.1 hypothetical protein C4K29_3182 [Pseudomonas chlororaphis subsp. piscium]